MQTTVVTYHLEMTAPSQLRPSQAEGAELQILKAEIPCPEFNRFLYASVGGDWYWIDRLSWTYPKWEEYLARPEIHTWVGYVAGTPAGYFELEQQAEGSVEIVYFGLLSQFIGQGLGGRLLTAAIEQAWKLDAHRVWVHTCSLDGPTALRNYQARGFQVFLEESEEAEIPDSPPGPWPNARDRSE